MTVRGIDHVAITVDDVEATAEFYGRVLGAEVLYLDRFREGRFPIISLVIGANRMNVHPSPPPAGLVARLPTPGSVDLCFRWDGGIDTALALLAEHGLDVVEGPSFRLAADNSKGQSVYFRDPDGNLLELLTTD